MLFVGYRHRSLASSGATVVAVQPNCLSITIPYLLGIYPRINHHTRRTRLAVATRGAGGAHRALANDSMGLHETQ